MILWIIIVLLVILIIFIIVNNKSCIHIVFNILNYESKEVVNQNLTFKIIYNLNDAKKYGKKTINKNK